MQTRTHRLRADRADWIFWLTALLILGAGLGLRDPWPADEPRFALVARQMVDSGDWLFPRRGIELYSDKPPMLMWLQAAAFGPVRNWRVAFLLPSLLAALGTLALVKDLGRRLFNLRAGLYAAWALLLAFQFAFQSRRAQIDPLVTFLITLANYGLLRHILLGPAWRWWWLGWFAAGLGVITKGVGVLALLMLLPAVFAAWRGWQSRGQPVILHARDMRFWLAPVAFLAAIALWLGPMWLGVHSRSDPAYTAYARDILFRQTAKRYSASWAHVHSPLYFLGVMAYAWLPTVLVFPWAFSAWRRRLQRGDARFLLPLGWWGLVLLFFSIPAGKRDMYILPALPMVCLALGPLLPGLLRKKGLKQLLALFVAVLGAGLAAAGAALSFGHPAFEAKLAAARGLSNADALGWMLLAMGLAALVALAIWRRAPERALAAAMTAIWVLFGVVGHVVLNDSSSSRGLMQRVGQRIGPGAELALLGWREQTLLMADRPAVTFGFNRDMAAQTTDALRWLQAAPSTRWLLVEESVMPACVPGSGRVNVGQAHRRDWVLVPGPAAAACTGWKGSGASPAIEPNED